MSEIKENKHAAKGKGGVAGDVAAGGSRAGGGGSGAVADAFAGGASAGSATSAAAGGASAGGAGAPAAGSGASGGRGKESKGKKKGDFATLLEFAGSRRPLVYVGCVLSAVSMLISFVPYICIWLVARDLLAVAPDWGAAHNLALWGWLAFAAALVGMALYLLALLCTHFAAFRCAANIRKTCIAHLMKTNLGYFDSHASGALRRVIDGCASQTEGLIAHKTPDAAGSLAMVAGMVVVLFVFDWRMGLACLVAAVASICCMFSMMGGNSAHFMQRYQTALVNMSKTGTEYVRGIPVVKVFQQTVYSFKAFHDAISEYSQMAEDYAVKVCAKPQVTSLTIINGVVVLLVPVALFLAPGAYAAGAASFAAFAADFVFYAIFSAIIATACTRLMFIMEDFEVAADAAKRVGELLRAPVLERAESPRVPADNSLAFEHVTFRYEGAERDALHDVTFSVPAGSTVALVGPSGGGKTTAASLVPRFWDASAGVVRVGGEDVRDIDPAQLMRSVAFVFQRNRLFKKSILENVRAARPEATRREVFAALSAAQCDDIIEKMPQGADTVIGTRGVHLSGGEQQRIALARAILKDAPIVVLDEATAFADPESEALIQQAMSRLAQGRTVLMIAHRLSTVVNADVIVVLEDGRVAEQGTHAQLVAAGGVYAKMWADYLRAAQWKISSAAASGEATGCQARAAAGSQPAREPGAAASAAVGVSGADGEVA